MTDALLAALMAEAANADARAWLRHLAAAPEPESEPELEPEPEPDMNNDDARYWLKLLGQQHRGHYMRPPLRTEVRWEDGNE